MPRANDCSVEWISAYGETKVALSTDFTNEINSYKEMTLPRNIKLTMPKNTKNNNTAHVVIDTLNIVSNTPTMFAANVSC